ncbi:hypothetical protein [Henriciella aquimarina]|uniref:hypothetical protein n=1 Tax=Henriciella aquimarina TaxID=545261 RepID=UPI0009FDF188|nr:hypothetical protein [Henriciella aquimarina]
MTRIQSRLRLLTAMPRKKPRAPVRDSATLDDIAENLRRLPEMMRKHGYTSSVRDFPFRAISDDEAKIAQESNQWLRDEIKKLEFGTKTPHRPYLVPADR